MSLAQPVYPKPFPQPFREVYVAYTPVSFRFKPLKASRLCLPADFTTDKLAGWNQKTSRLKGNPWKGQDVATQIADSVASLLINSGTTVGLDPLNPYPQDYIAVGGNAIRTGSWNWSLDKTVKKFSFEFYLDNDLEETTPTVIYDDDETVWSAWQGGTGSYAVTLSEELTTKIKGTSSLKAVVGTGANSYVGYVYSFAAQDWSSKDFIRWYFYGSNSGRTITCRISDGTYLREWAFTDNFTGWKRFVKPLLTGDSPSSINLAAVTSIRFYWYPAAAMTVYHDRTLIDVGQWVKVECFVPDALAASGDKWRLYAWNQGTSAYRASPFLTDSTLTETEMQFLDQTLQSQILAAGKGGAAYALGGRGDVKTATGDTGAGSITYSSNYGCKKRIGFAVKMPPDDGQDSSTAGISQCRLKLEVLYGGDAGETTYEFENSANAYFGLQNWSKQWLSLFDPTSKTLEYLILTKRPTVLEIQADHNEDVKYIDATLPVGCRVFAGSLYHGDHTRDTDSDGVPDIFDVDLPYVVAFGEKAMGAEWP